MKPRAATLSDLKALELKPQQKNETADNGSVKAALLITTIVLVASNAGWMLYMANQQKKMNELLIARNKKADELKQA
jgi:hypothetical protein